jgi:hypothetical protein
VTCYSAMKVKFFPISQGYLKEKSPKKTWSNLMVGYGGFLDGYLDQETHTLWLLTLDWHNGTITQKTDNFEFVFHFEGLPKFLPFFFKEPEFDLKDN